MNIKKVIISTAIALVVFASFSKAVFAKGTPAFPSCLNPQGTLKVKYNSGTHGIVGDTRVYTGKDEVYTISDDTVLQCFCPDSGNGIQTNWWKAEDFTTEEIKSYQSRGWHFVPNGEAWGLSTNQYLAINSNYACIGGIGGGELGDVLSLAFTGNITYIYSIAFLGFILITTGVLLGLKANKRS